MDDTLSLCVAALDQAPFAALIFQPDADLTILWRNSAHETMSASIGRDVSGLGMFEAFPPNEADGGDAAVDALHRAAQQLRDGAHSVDIGPYRFDLSGEDGTYLEYHWQMQMSRIEVGGQLAGILQVAQDVTHRVLSQKLADSHKRATRVAAGVGYFSYDPVTDIFVRGRDVDAMFGFAEDEAGPHAAPFFERVAPEHIDGVHAEVARVLAAPRGEVASFDYRADLPDGGARYLRIRGEMATDPVDRRPRLVGTFVDLTDVEENRQKLRALVDLKESLVSEANHRIKNSLQMALSMLRIEASALRRNPQATVERAVDAMGIAEQRIRSVAAIHGMMRLDGNAARVDFDLLLAELLANTRASVGMDETDLRLEGARIGAALDSDTAIVMGLIVNELLTNAIKYGWSEAEGCAITIRRVRAGNSATLTIENPILVDEARRMRTDSSGIGGELITGFLAQIGASIDKSQSGGTYRVSITFPLSD